MNNNTTSPKENSLVTTVNDFSERLRKNTVLDYGSGERHPEFDSDSDIYRCYSCDRLGRDEYSHEIVLYPVRAFKPYVRVDRVVHQFDERRKHIPPLVQLVDSGFILPKEIGDEIGLESKPYILPDPFYYQSPQLLIIDDVVSKDELPPLRKWLLGI